MDSTRLCEEDCSVDKAQFQRQFRYNSIQKHCQSNKSRNHTTQDRLIILESRIFHKSPLIKFKRRNAVMLCIDPNYNSTYPRLEDKCRTIPGKSPQNPRQLQNSKTLMTKSQNPKSNMPQVTRTCYPQVEDI